MFEVSNLDALLLSDVERWDCAYGRGRGGGDKEGGIKPPAAKKQHIIFPSIERVLVKFSYLLLNTTLLNEKPFDGVF